MRVLIACECSGVVRRAFRDLGHDAWSCDLQPAEDASPFHYHCDVREVLYDQWDLLIAHPVCKYLTNSGVRWLHSDPSRWAKMEEGTEFFKLFDRCEHIPRRCVENPIMHGHALKIVGRKATQFIQPWMFGHGETKATGLWLTNLPKLEPTNIVEGREARVHKMAPGPERERERSRTLPGIGLAMATRWG